MKLFLKIIILFFLIINNSYSNYKEDIKLLYNKIYDKYGEKSIEILDKILEKKREENIFNQKVLEDLIKINNEKNFLNSLEKEEKEIKKILNENILSNSFENKILNNYGLIKENGIWYYYDYKNFLSFENNNFTKEDLKRNNIDFKKYIITVKDNKISFIKEYKKFRIISDNIIYGIPGKLEILKDLIFIKYLDKIDENLDKDFIILKSLSKKITKGFYKKEDIIKIIYNYILENLKYEENIKDGDYNIYSGIKTFKNKVGVCQGYVELFNIMLAFNNIKSEIIKGDVVNSDDFPKIGHAWVKIDNFYYDPTFDDPIGIKNTKKFEDYFYYKLPKDLFYTNRYNRGETPEFLKKLNKNQRQTYVDLNIFSISEKYKNKDLNILNIVKFKKEIGLSAKQEIKIQNLIKKFGITEINNGRVIIDGKEKILKELEYFNISNENILNFLYQIKFNFNSYKIFKDIETGKILISNKYSFR